MHRHACTCDCQEYQSMRPDTTKRRISPRIPAFLLSALMFGCPGSGIGLPQFIGTFPDGATEAISFDSSGTLPQGGASQPAISGNGKIVAYSLYDVSIISNAVYLTDRTTGQISLVSVATDGTPGNKGGQNPSLSADGRFVAFESDSTQLVSGDINNVTDVFVHDRLTGKTEARRAQRQEVRISGV